MRFGSLFAGAGGLDLGLEAAGMTCAFQVELDDYATRVLEKNWPSVPRWRDIRNVNPDELPAIDLLAGGFPCQPHSVAGKRKASQDERDLWPEYFRLIRAIRPRWVLAENVTGLLSSESGRYFAGILRDLASIGFDAEWDCIPASAVGAPHHRDRIWLVAYPNDQRCQERLAPAEPGSAGLATWLSASDASDADRLGRQGDKECDERTPSGEQAPCRRHTDGRTLSWAPPRRVAAWPPESCPVGMAHGVAHRSHRLRLTGNGVVSDVAEHVGRMILEADRARWPA